MVFFTLGISECFHVLKPYRFWIGIAVFNWRNNWTSNQLEL